jgi:ABC-type bacteriocin/lantibiotic exporter with double-glycine peptidase domain
MRQTGLWYRLILVVSVLMVSGLVAGCTTPPSAPPVASFSSSLPERIELTQVPFYAQTEDQCGPASLAMLLTYAGLERTPEQMRDEVYLPQRNGSLTIEMVGALRRSGLTPRVVGTDLNSLLRQVADGQPVAVLINVRWRVWPQWHYAVVVGYDLTQQHILLRSGMEARHRMGLQEFDARWADGQRWGVAVLTQATSAPQELVR